MDSLGRDKNINLKYILNTHHHFDHIGGNKELKKKYNSIVVGFKHDSERIPEIDICLEDNEIWKSDNFIAKIIHVPGHTKGHICFHFYKDKLLFTGDTLFSLGCGRIFEGTYEQMFSSLNKIKAMPLDTKIFCGHEYTLSNLKFALEVDEDNKLLADEYINVKNLISSDIPSLPTSLNKELKMNPFLRCNEINIKNKVFDKFDIIDDELEIFTALRKWKDNF